MNGRLIITLIVTVKLMSLYFGCVEGEHKQLIRQHPCALKVTLQECMQTPTCAWCSKSTFDGERCFERSDVNSNVQRQCGERFVHYPISNNTIVESQELQKARKESQPTYNKSRISRSFSFNMFSSSFLLNAINSNRHDTNESCIMDGGVEVCSGHGHCEYGQCKCSDENGIRYFGKFCEKSPTCPGRCLEFIDCVQCQVFETGPLTPEECETSCTINPNIVKMAEADGEKDENLCLYYDHKDCRLVYVYSCDRSGKVVIRVQEKRDCPSQMHSTEIILGISGAVVLIGCIYLLLSKLVTARNDKQDVAKFEELWDLAGNPSRTRKTPKVKKGLKPSTL